MFSGFPALGNGVCGTKLAIANCPTNLPTVERTFIRQNEVNISDHVEPFYLRWSLWGTKIIQWWGVDYTERLIGYILEVRKALERYVRPYIQRLIDNRLIGHVAGTL